MFTRKRLLIIAVITIIAGLILAITDLSGMLPPDTPIILIALGVICFLLSNIVPRR
ncbi:hypothetical protein [Lentibacillus sp.]|uniref:hypothetical protein n=1 Tax=Lentibacillus sp. TaxID=1925746 RepID=UPI002B4B15FB|nr:hypothetical protein [Lentibacillus sp.]HLS09881.1 hypothetical protein [Lentibacillus sp.]